MRPEDKDKKEGIFERLFPKRKEEEHFIYWNLKILITLCFLMVLMSFRCLIIVQIG